MELTTQTVEDLFEQCFEISGEIVEGIMRQCPMDTTGKEEEIGELLAQLPDEFQATKGGGWSFLNACQTKSGEQWTGMHATMDKLFILGIAAGKARFVMPREFWASLPGGMPYVSVN